MCLQRSPRLKGSWRSRSARRLPFDHQSPSSGTLLRKPYRSLFLSVEHGSNNVYSAAECRVSLCFNRDLLRRCWPSFGGPVQMPTAEDLSSATAPLPPGTFTTSAHSDEWKIANALSAGPTTIAEHAAVMDWPVNPKDPIESALRDRAMPRSRWDTQVDRRRSYISIDERLRRAQAEAEQRSCHAGAR